MKTRLVFHIAGVLIAGLAFLPIADSNRSAAQEQRRPSAERTAPQWRRSIEEYRKAIKDMYNVDIANFKDRIKGGKADGKPITNYDLKELLAGVKFEREHTDDNLLALEMAMDHLETVPDYYSRHQRWEQEIMSEKLLDH
jgi:hypothetical protein